MPEGDTIHRTAAALRAALVGKPLRTFRVARGRGFAPRLGAVTERVESRGKHLDIVWDDGVVLHTHLRMSGAWHLYRSGERWRRPAGQARVVIGVEGFDAVCFGAPVVELHHRSESRHRDAVLGPDLCREEADIDVCVERIGRWRDPGTPIADVLLDQRIACGVGNVYKSEVLWACRVHPLQPVGTLDRATRRQLLDTAARLLRANLAGPGRVTIPGVRGGLAVYGRAGRPCPRCSTRIVAGRLGEHARITAWCPACQATAE
jgi:endonuclease VIII